MQSYRQALALRPNDSLAMNNLAYTLANNGSPRDLDDALQLVQRALVISPHESDFQDTLAWVWLKKGQSDQAVQIFTELCKEKPSNPSYRHHLGLALLAHGDNAAAQKTFELALASGPSQGESIEIKAELARAAQRR
jgi:Flp pilus assembly protein TadD